MESKDKIKKDKNNKWGIAIIIVLLVLCLGYILYLCISEEKQITDIKYLEDTKPVEEIIIDLAKNKSETLTYTINGDIGMTDNENFANRGVIYDTLNTVNAPHIYTISMGRKNTGGYSIKIKDVEIDTENNVVVTVVEQNPGPDDMVTMAFTTPTCSITFNLLPKSIKVINESNEEFNHINF